MTSDSPSPGSARAGGKKGAAKVKSTAPNANPPAKPNPSAPPTVIDTVSTVEASPAAPPGTRVRDRSLNDPSAATNPAARDLADVSAVELISTVSVHLLSAAALRCGLADEGEDLQDLSEARVIINALAGLVTAAAPDLGDTHARALRDGLRSVQLAFLEASTVPDAPGEGPGEKYTGAVR